VKAFGVPTVILRSIDDKKHVVFGSDRIHIIAMLLSESVA